MTKHVSYTAEVDPFVALPDWVLTHPTLSPHDKIVWAALKYFWNRRTGQCNPAHQTIANLVGVSKRTVQNSLQRLEAEELIVVTANLKGGKSANQYHLRGWQEMPIADSRVANDSTRVAGDAYPGVANGATNLEDLDKEERAHASNNPEGDHWHMVVDGRCRRAECEFVEDEAATV